MSSAKQFFMTLSLFPQSFFLHLFNRHMHILHHHFGCRKEKNRSGSISIVVIDKSNGKFREVKTIGTSSDISELEKLYVNGNQ
jgi:hypothetical protein